MKPYPSILVALVMVIAAAAGCSVYDENGLPPYDLARGDGDSYAFATIVDRYDIVLSPDIDSLEWIELSAFDSNHLWLRVVTNRAGADRLLRECGLDPQSLHHPRGDADPLPRQSGWAPGLPTDTLAWAPSPGARGLQWVGGEGRFTVKGHIASAVVGAPQDADQGSTGRVELVVQVSLG